MNTMETCTGFVIFNLMRSLKPLLNHWSKIENCVLFGNISALCWSPNLNKWKFIITCVEIWNYEFSSCQNTHNEHVWKKTSNSINTRACLLFLFTRKHTQRQKIERCSYGRLSFSIWIHSKVCSFFPGFISDTKIIPFSRRHKRIGTNSIKC